MNSTFPTRLRAARNAKGLSCRALDKEAGHPQGHCALIERDTYERFESKTIQDYARALGCDPGWLAFGTGEAPDLTAADAAPSPEAA